MGWWWLNYLKAFERLHFKDYDFFNLVVLFRRQFKNFKSAFVNTLVNCDLKEKKHLRSSERANQIYEQRVPFSVHLIFRSYFQTSNNCLSWGRYFWKFCGMVIKLNWNYELRELEQTDWLIQGVTKKKKYYTRISQEATTKQSYFFINAEIHV